VGFLFVNVARIAEGREVHLTSIRIIRHRSMRLTEGGGTFDRRIEHF